MRAATCEHYHNKLVRDIPGDHVIQCDEVWSFVYAKDKALDWAEPWDKAGTVWTWTALDTDSKLLVSYKVRKRRNGKSATVLMRDLAGRLGGEADSGGGQAIRVQEGSA